jgi:hypothetical protein
MVIPPTTVNDKGTTFLLASPEHHDGGLQTATTWVELLNIQAEEVRCGLGLR